MMKQEINFTRNHQQLNFRKQNFTGVFLQTVSYQGKYRIGLFSLISDRDRKKKSVSVEAYFEIGLSLSVLRRVVPTDCHQKVKLYGQNVK